MKWIGTEPISYKIRPFDAVNLLLQSFEYNCIPPKLAWDVFGHLRQENMNLAQIVKIDLILYLEIASSDASYEISELFCFKTKSI